MKPVINIIQYNIILYFKKFQFFENYIPHGGRENLLEWRPICNCFSFIVGYTFPPFVG